VDLASFPPPKTPRRHNISFSNSGSQVLVPSMTGKEQEILGGRGMGVKRRGVRVKTFLLRDRPI